MPRSDSARALRASHRGQTVKRLVIFSGFVNCCWWLFRWSLLLAVAAALAVGGYLYFRLDDEIRRQVEQRLAGHYRNLTVHVGSARFDKDHGIVVRDITFVDPTSGAAGQPLLVIDELLLAGTIRVEQLLSGTLPIEQITVRRPRMTAQRQLDGHWNVQTLLPPPKFSEQAPPVVVDDATLTLKDAARSDARPLVLRGIDLTLTPVPSEPVGGEGQLYRVAGTAAGLSAGELRVKGDISTTGGRMDITISAAALEVSPDLFASIPIELPKELADVQIAGLANAAVHIVRPTGRSAEIGWSAQVQLERGRLQFAHEQPPLTDLACHIQADRQRFVVKRLTAKWGMSEVTLACERNGWTADAPLGLSARVRSLTMDRDLAAALPAQFAGWWKRFEPVGKIDVELRMAFDGNQWRPRVIADCRGVSLTDVERFPYRIEQAAGRVEYLPAVAGGVDRLKIDLTGVGNNRPLTIKADLTQLVAEPPDNRRRRTGVAAHPHSPTILVGSENSTPQQPDQDGPAMLVRSAGYRGTDPAPSPLASRYHPVGWIELSGSDMVVHEPLLVALEAGSRQGGQFVRSLRPQGTFDFRWRAEWKDRVQPRAATSLDVTLQDCNLQFDRFEYPLRHVRGLVTQRNGRWAIQDAEGRGGNDSTVVRCRGEATPVENGLQWDLVFEATNVPLDDNLKQALSPKAQQAWANIRPQGRVDFTAHVVHSPGGAKPKIDVALRPRERSVTIEPVQFPYRFEQLDGVARFSEGRVELEQVRAVHGRTGFLVRAGTWQATEGGWQFGLSGLNVDRLEPQRELIAALPPGLQKVIERLQPTGGFGLHESSLTFVKRPDSARLASAWDVNLDCHQATLSGGMQLSNISGGIRLAGQSNEQSSYTAGELAIHSMSWKGAQLTSVRGPLWADPSVCLFGQPAAAQQGRVPQPITADAYGGSVAANIRLEHQTNPNFRVELAIGGADLARFVNERLGGAKELTGKVSGTLLLVGGGQSTRTLKGGGELHVVDGNIYELPVVVSLLKVLRNRAPNTTAFNRCDMKFQVLGEDVVFDQLNLLGDAGSLYGEGKTNFDRKLDLVFYSLMGPADLPIPFYKSILGQASKQTLTLKVSGTWDVPLIEPNVLPGVNDALERLQTELEAGAATVTSPSAMRNAIMPRR
ncbi:MAG: hypothetical protein WD669_07730 [Pirellulales bacterium]